jgi:hypothetical protein
VIALGEDAFALKYLLVRNVYRNSDNGAEQHEDKSQQEGNVTCGSIPSFFGRMSDTKGVDKDPGQIKHHPHLNSILVIFCSGTVASTDDNDEPQLTVTTSASLVPLP